MNHPPSAETSEHGNARPTLADSARVWSRVGWLGFGGPAGQIALMHRELVEQRRWISEPRFLHALNYCMLLPGPEAQQLAIYIGWLMHRTWGGLIAGLLFVLPGAIVLGVLSALYVRFGNVPFVTALFLGLNAAVLAIVVEAVLRIGRRALKSWFLIALAGIAFLAIFALNLPFPLIVLGAALTGLTVSRLAPSWLPASRTDTAETDQHYLVDRMLARGEASHTAPSLPRSILAVVVSLILWFTPVLLAAWWLGADHVIAREGRFFSQTAVVTFGGAYAVLAYVAQRAVEDFAWLQPGQMIDGLALAETTPGPLVMVLQFVGFVAAYSYPGTLNPWIAGLLGAAITTWVTFAPCFLFIFVGAPYVEALRRNKSLNAALSAITAAVVGVVLNLSAWFALHTVFGELRTWNAGLLQIDLPVWSSWQPGALLLTAAALIAVLRFKMGLPWLLPATALGGLLLKA